LDDCRKFTTQRTTNFFKTFFFSLLLREKSDRDAKCDKLKTAAEEGAPARWDWILIAVWEQSKLPPADSNNIRLQRTDSARRSACGYR